MSLKNYFAALEEIYNNVVPHLSAVLISCNHSITRIISFYKNRFTTEIIGGFIKDEYCS
jgi:hypothetical protein